MASHPKRLYSSINNSAVKTSIQLLQNISVAYVQGAKLASTQVGLKVSLLVLVTLVEIPDDLVISVFTRRY
jgi:hypothetical protein